MRQAIHHLTGALKLDLGFGDARQTLGLVYYESGPFREMVDLYVEGVRREPGDPTGYFFIGLGLQAQEKLKRAYRYYMAGLSRMSDEEQSLIKSIVLMTEPEELRRGCVPLPDVEEQNAFWTGWDPLFLSPMNERLMEHCGRAVYANLRFADRHRKLDGRRIKASCISVMDAPRVASSGPLRSASRISSPGITGTSRSGLQTRSRRRGDSRGDGSSGSRSTRSEI